MTPDSTPTSTEPTLQSGSILADKYRLEREIGRGAMGTVWLATHVTLEQVVAIKVISREHAASPELRQRVSTEARAAAKLRSRHVVGVYDHGETTDGLPFIVLEFLDGESLEDRLAREGCIPLVEAVRVVRHVGRALSRAHAHGIVHRDLKPANVFLTHTDDDEGGWTAKVLDFGVAKMSYGGKSATKTGALIGTPLFMSPEQVRGASDIDHRADLYSLGVVFYNMITGQYAFDGTTFGDLLISICTDPLPSLRRAAPWIPDELEAWFQRACARKPEERFVDADEMVEALEVAVGLNDARRSLAGGNQTHPGLASGHLGAASSSSGVETAKGHAPPAALPPELTSSSISSPGAAITVNLPPPRRSRAPWWLGAGFAAAVGLALSLSGGTEDAGRSTPEGEDPSPAPARPALQTPALQAPALEALEREAPEGEVLEGAPPAPEEAPPGAGRVAPSVTERAKLQPKPPTKRPPRRGAKTSIAGAATAKVPPPAATSAPPSAPPATATTASPKSPRPAVPDLGF